MKAKFIAIALSLSVTTLSAYAALPKEASIKKKPPLSYIKSILIRQIYRCLLVQLKG